MQVKSVLDFPERGALAESCFLYGSSDLAISLDDNLWYEKYDGFEPLFDGLESEASLSKRHGEFINTWNFVEDAYNTTLEMANAVVIRDILSFIGCAFNDTLKLKKNFGTFIKELPTALIYAGVNLSDHELMFAKIVHNIRKAPQHRVAVLRSKDSPHIRNMLNDVVHQFINPPHVDVNDDSTASLLLSKNAYRSPDLLVDLESTDATSYRNTIFFSKQNKAPPSKSAADMLTLQLWYNELLEKPCLIILLQDFESFHPGLIQDFIAICHEYRDTLPLIFLFGIATSMDVLPRMLPRSTMSLLRTEKFYLQQSLDTLASLIQTLFIRRSIGFRLAYQPLRNLVGNFVLHNFSLHAFMKAIKYAMMQHYFSHSYSILCLNERPSGVQWDQLLAIIDANHCESIRHMLSFRSFVESTIQPEEQFLLLTDDKFLKQQLRVSIEALFDYQETYGFCLEVLFLIQNQLNLATKKSITSLYESGLENDLNQHDFVHILLNHLSHLDKSRRKQLSERTLELSKQYRKQFPRNHQLDMIFLSMSQFVENISNDQATEELNADIRVFYETLLLKHLVCYRSFPFHEILYSDDLTSLKKVFNPQPLTSLQTALTVPTEYLNCTCCQDVYGSHVHDTCLAYKVYRECPRLINLYEWFEAFCSVRGEGSTNHSELQARFVRCVSELEFMGFLKTTKKKTDHVLRLTWA